MLKVLAAVLAVLSAVISITIYTTTLPAVKKQGEDNAAAITSNETYIKTVDDALENLQDGFDGIDDRVESLENKKLYIHYITIFSQSADTLRVNLAIINSTNTAFTVPTLTQYLFNNGLKYSNSTLVCSGKYSGHELIGIYGSAEDNLYVQYIDDVLQVYTIQQTQNISDKVVEL